MKEKTMANIDGPTLTAVKKIEALTNLSQNFFVLREKISGGKLYHCVCRHILLDRKPQRQYITYKELVNNIKYEPLLQQWVSYQTKHGNNNKKKELNSTQCIQGNKTWENKYKYQKWHKTNKRSNLCENIVFEKFAPKKAGFQLHKENSGKNMNTNCFGQTNHMVTVWKRRRHGMENTIITPWGSHLDHRLPTVRGGKEQ